MAARKTVFDRRLYFVALSVAIYMALFALMTYTPGKGMTMTTIIPIVIAAWLYGVRAGIGAGLLSAPVNILMCLLLGLDWKVHFYTGGVGIAGTLIEILIGAVVGKLHDYNQRIQKELALRKVLEAELQQHRNRLEEMVQEKTEELEASNRQLQESQLAMSRARDYIENLFRTSPDAILVTDADGYIVMANESVYDVYGYRPEELLGQHGAILTPEDEKAVQTGIALLEELFEKGLVRNFTAVRKHKDGRFIQIETSAVLLKNPDGTVAGGISSTRDITDKKRLEEQLRQSQKMEAIGTLAGGIAHDFNNILGVIIGYTELSQDLSGGNETLTQNLSQVLTAAERAKNLVRQILAFSRKSDSELKPQQMHLIVKEVLKLLRSSLPTTIDIRADLSATDDVVIADATQVHQIIMNLCTNAAHAMLQAGGVLEVKLKPLDLDLHSAGSYSGIAQGPFVHLSVRDTGVGIPPGIIGRIFEPFFTTKELGSGTGMGLAVVHGIVKRLWGDIKVYSEPGKGTVFHVLLPRVRETVEADAAMQAAPGGQEAVLLVDDELMLLNVGTLMLGTLGYHVTAMQSPLEALELFKKDPAAFDIVITDQTMPGMTGYELGQRLMALRSDIPVILCTGYSDLVTAESAVAAGIKSFVIKPLNRLAIAETIRSALDTK